MVPKTKALTFPLPSFMDKTKVTKANCSLRQRKALEMKVLFLSDEKFLEIQGGTDSYPQAIHEIPSSPTRP